MRTRGLVPVAVLTSGLLLVAAAACGTSTGPGASPSASPSRSSSPVSPSASPSSLSPSATPTTVAGPVWPIEPRALPAPFPIIRPQMDVAVLQAIRTGRHGTYERAVFDLSEPFGDVRVGYVPAVREDPSDRVVALQGRSFLQIVIHDAVARYAGTPITPYRGPDTVLPGFPTLKQVSISGDFEAVLSFGIGLDRTAGFRVMRLSSPDRLVVDVAAPPAWRMWPDDSLAEAEQAQRSVDQGHQPWRGDPVDMVTLYARSVYGIGEPAVSRVGPDTYRLAHRGSDDSVTVRVARPFPTSPLGIVEIADTR